MKRTIVLLAALAVVLLAALAVASPAAQAARRNLDPDWPCQQVKVSELSVGSFWNGPAIDPASADWQRDEAVATLVGAVTQRRLPMDAAAQRIDAFAKTAGADKDRKLPLLFAGVFDVLNHERAKVLDGLDRFGRRQKVLADGIRLEGEALRAAQAATPPDEAKISDLTQRLQWDQQFFDARRQSLRFACDLPQTIEQRLYGLAQVIQSHLTE
jgi:Spy/CpxP family protein refolding chaperone